MEHINVILSFNRYRRQPMSYTVEYRSGTIERGMMRHLKRFLMLSVILYMVVSLAGADRFLNKAIAHSSEPLVIRIMDEEITVGSVQVLSSESDVAITMNVDEEYKIYSTAVTFRFNSGGITRALSFGRDSGLVKKTDHQHVYNISMDRIVGDNVQVAASAVVVANELMYLTPKAFFRIPTTTTTSIVGPTSTSETTSTTTTNQPTTTTDNQGSTTTSIITSSTTVRHGGGGGGGAVTSTTTNTTISSIYANLTTTTTDSGAVAGTTTSTTLQNITPTTLTAVTTPTRKKPSVSRERLPYTGSNYNWYLIGFLFIIAGLLVFYISSRIARRPTYRSGRPLLP